MLLSYSRGVLFCALAEAFSPLGCSCTQASVTACCGEDGPGGMAEAARGRPASSIDVRNRTFMKTSVAFAQRRV